MKNKMTTYNDLLSQFAIQCFPTLVTETISIIKATFKRLTTVSINEPVTDYNLQLVIDWLSNATVPHCNFANWLRKAKEKPTTPAVATIHTESDFEYVITPEDTELPEAGSGKEMTIADLFETSYPRSYGRVAVNQARQFCAYTGLGLTLPIAFVEYWGHYLPYAVNINYLKLRGVKVKP